MPPPTPTSPVCLFSRSGAGRGRRRPGHRGTEATGGSHHGAGDRAGGGGSVVGHRSSTARWRWTDGRRSPPPSPSCLSSGNRPRHDGLAGGGRQHCADRRAALLVPPQADAAASPPLTRPTQATPQPQLEPPHRCTAQGPRRWIPSLQVVYRRDKV